MGGHRGNIGGGIGARRRVNRHNSGPVLKFNPLRLHSRRGYKSRSVRCFINDERVKFLVEVTGDDQRVPVSQLVPWHLSLTFLQGLSQQPADLFSFQRHKPAVLIVFVQLWAKTGVNELYPSIKKNGWRRNDLNRFTIFRSESSWQREAHLKSRR
jgi:hypothetical protein